MRTDGLVLIFWMGYLCMAHGRKWGGDEHPLNQGQGRIDYQKVYHLRFNPSEMHRTDEFSKSPLESEVRRNHDHPDVDQHGVPLKTNKLEDYLIESVGNESVISSKSNYNITNIMRPTNQSGIAQTIQLLSSRLKTLLFASGATLIRAPAKGKGFLNLFEVIKFENSECQSSLNGIRELTGICYHEFECSTSGGIPMGACAGGIGVCCVFKHRCGNHSRQMVSYFESPNYPQPVREMLVCVLTVELRKHVQQLMLEFLLFELNRPTGGNCIDDQFTISGQNTNFLVPIMCGINTGQHIYIDVEHSKGRKIYISIFGKNTSPKAFNIKITQLETNLAPAGCLQYHLEPNGIIKSFNYEEDGSVIESKEASYFNNLNYAICIRRAPEMCSISYLNEVNNEEYVFQLTNKDEEDNDINPRGQAGAGILNCPDDYIAINDLRLCGDKLNDGSLEEDFTLNSIVRDSGQGPIVLPFRTDGEITGRGFKLIYYQELCN